MSLGHRRPVIATFVLGMLVFEVLSRTVIADLSFQGGPLALYELSRAFERWPTRPVVIFLGSSHAQCGIVPAVLEASAGLPQGSVVNAGRKSLMVRDCLWLYERSRGVLGRARVAVVEVGDYSFNRNVAVAAEKGPPAWRRRASLTDRLLFPANLDTKGDWTAGWFLATWDLRATWRDVVGIGWLKAWERLGLPDRTPLFEADGRAVTPEEHVGMTPKLLAGDAVNAAARHLQRYRLDAEAYEDLARLVGLVAGDGGRVVLLEYPVSREYREEVRARYPAEDQFWRRELKARLPGVVLMDGNVLAEGLGPPDFRDADHLSRRGAGRFSERLAARLRSPLAAEGSPQR